MRVGEIVEKIAKSDEIDKIIKISGRKEKKILKQIKEFYASSEEEICTSFWMFYPSLRECPNMLCEIIVYLMGEQKNDN